MIKTNFHIRQMFPDDIEQAEQLVRNAFAEQEKRWELPESRLNISNGLTLSSVYSSTPAGCFVAETNTGETVGVVANRQQGSVAVLGPLCVKREFQAQGAAQLLMKTSLDYSKNLNLKRYGLATYPASGKHLSLYTNFGFVPTFLTLTMCKDLNTQNYTGDFQAGIEFNETDMPEPPFLQTCDHISDKIYPGWKLSPEMAASLKQGTNRLLILLYNKEPVGFASYRISDVLARDKLKNIWLHVLLIRPGESMDLKFICLLKRCEQIAKDSHCEAIALSVNTGCLEAYKRLLQLGFRIEGSRIRMVRGDSIGYEQPNQIVLDDYR